MTVGSVGQCANVPMCNLQKDYGSGVPEWWVHGEDGEFPSKSEKEICPLEWHLVRPPDGRS